MLSWNPVIDFHPKISQNLHLNIRCMNPKNCEYCKEIEARHIGTKYKICGYCMQPVTEEQQQVQQPQQEIIVGKESASLLTTSGVTALAIFGFEISVFNSLLIGLLSAVILVGMVKPAILVLKSFGVLGLFLLFADKMVDLIVYFVHQVNIYFKLTKEISNQKTITIIQDLITTYS